MDYNIHYCVVSVMYLSITTVYYRSLRQLKSPRVRLFSILLYLGLISIVLDAAMASTDAIAELFPTWLLYVGNILFLACLHFCGAVLFTYVLVITGFYKNMTLRQKLLILLPFAALSVCLLISPFGTAGVFYLDSANRYHSGATHFAIYTQMAVYLLACAYFIFVQQKHKDKTMQRAFLAFLVFAIGGMLIQSVNPRNLLTSMILTVGITIICFVFESPSRHVDALTGIFNITALPGCLKSAYNKAADFSLIVFSFRGFSYINHTVGVKTSDSILVFFARQLEQLFPNAQFFRTGGDEFSVLLYNCGYIDLNRLRDLCADVPRRMDLGESSIRFHFTTACINSSSCSDYKEMLDLHSYLSRRGRSGSKPDEFIGGEEFIAKYQRTHQMEKAIKRALDEDRVQVYFQPIHNAAGKLTSAEALIRIEDAELGMLPAQECVELAERSGDILRLGELVLIKVCRFIGANRDIISDFDHISVNLSALQCARDDLAETTLGICSKYNTPNSLISFELTETAAASMAATKQSMDKLIAQGHCFFLDDFGTGYANFDHLVYLPFSYVKIDKSILWSAEAGTPNMVFLEKTVEMLKSLGIKSICEGVETSGQVQLLRDLGVTLQQGYYYSKPLSADDFVKYIQKERSGL